MRHRLDTKNYPASDDNSFLAARDSLLKWRIDYDTATAEFRWPRPSQFNWARDVFDRQESPHATALRIVGIDGTDLSLSFETLAARSHRVANFLDSSGIRRGDRVLVMLGNVPALWEIMLGIIRLGAVMIPATPLLNRSDLADRLDRGGPSAVVADAEFCARFEESCLPRLKVAVGRPVRGWVNYASVDSAEPCYATSELTGPDDPLLIYFTSGTTAQPKMVVHTQSSYPCGHLSTMYWLGLQPGDVHLNLSSPGWAKHAWSCVFSPWNAGATVLAYQYDRFDASALLDVLVRCSVTTFCAPPTVWRMLIQQDLKRWPVMLREITSAGEPLNPEVIDQVYSAWGLRIRDGFGQSETTAVIGNSPGQVMKPGSMGRPLPGYRISLLQADGSAGVEGEICIDLSERPVGLMEGYLDEPERTRAVLHDGFYHTGDIARIDSDGYLTFVGRVDDVFKSSDYRISPFELESVLLEHPAVAEAAVVPSPDPVRLAVPKAFVVLAVGHPPDASVADSILAHVRQRVSPFKRIRCIEFSELPKTISGKIQRTELRRMEQARLSADRRAEEFWEDDLPSG